MKGHFPLNVKNDSSRLEVVSVITTTESDDSMAREIRTAAIESMSEDL